MSIRLEIFDDGRWADQVAGRWTSFMEECPAARLCLPTGDTPRPVYSRAARSIDFGQAEIFLLDEFVLPAGDPARCDGVLRRDFLAKLETPPAIVHALDAQASDLDDECRRFEGLIDDAGLDLTILGLGGNGHLGLNEPGSAAESPTRVVRLAPATRVAAKDRYGSTTEPELGMTIGLRPILDSREVWLLVTGPNKTEILDRMLTGPIGPDLPASFLREHPSAVVLADRSAAG